MAKKRPSEGQPGQGEPRAKKTAPKTFGDKDKDAVCVARVMMCIGIGAYSRHVHRRYLRRVIHAIS